MEPINQPSSQLSPENLEQLATARRAYRKIGKAISIAQSDGWIIAVFAGLTLLCGLTDVPSIVLSIGFGTIAFFELKGAGKLRRLEPGAPQMLGINQLALSGALMIYGVWHIITALSGGGDLAQISQQSPELAQSMSEYGPLVRNVIMLFYGALIAVAIFGQGGLALYYFTRLKYLRTYLAQTPAWILAMQRAGMSI
jgi:hypothetical protein